ncbi:MFS transporter [Thermococcus sp. P6]|uniref:MFS transporter n=1 Tax=Thermococcus sp. P6 TaxID=122420 RepID=UPI001E35E09D|nr:MFS transporter [Thermococcus sp. P6]
MTVEKNVEYDLTYAKRAMLVVVILPLLIMYTEAMLTPALPTIQKEFAVNPNDISWVLTIYLLVGTVSVAIFGKLGDMYGKKKMFLIALSFYTLGVILNGFAPSFKWLLITRAIQGFGMAIFPLAFSLVREEFPTDMVPQVQGMISAMFGVGMVIALPLGAYVTENWGWRWTYHSAAPLAVIMLILAWKVLRESRYINPGKLDWPGVILLTWAVVPALIAVTRAPDVGWTAGQTITLFGASIVGIVLLYLWEKRAENPLLPIELITSRNPAIVNVGIMFAAFGIAMMNQANVYIFQMKPPYGFGKTILQSGLLMTPMALVMLFVAPLAGKLMPRVVQNRPP